jgi:ferredoxin-NADP reductase
MGLQHEMVMAEWRTGSVVELQRLSGSLATFSLTPEAGTRFPSYVAGQYIALRREHCPLTRLVTDVWGAPHVVAEVADGGRPAFGPVSHPYSIVSAPCDAAAQNRLEFCIAREIDREGAPGRLSSSLFDMETSGDHALSYASHMSGTFTLARRAAGADSVLMVATGTGIAPFASILRQLDHDAQAERPAHVRYTLIYANRTARELAYHSELRRLEAARRLDFVYIPSVSRPTKADDAASLGRGRANNLLRYVFGVPSIGDAIGQVVEPALPPHVCRGSLSQRFNPASTVVLTCGNPLSVADIRLVAETRGFRVETENW